MATLIRQVFKAMPVIIFSIIFIILPVEASLAPGGCFWVNSTPSGATVCIDNSGCKTAPAYYGYMSYGTYVLSIILNGYETYITDIYVGIGQHCEVFNADLKPDIIPAGSLRVNTTPSGSTVCIDRIFCKTVPATFDNLSGNRYHVLKISNGDSKQVLIDNIMVVPRTTIEVNEVLPHDQPVPSGIVHVNLSPPGTSIICIDGNCNVWRDTKFYFDAYQYHTITVLGNNFFRPFSTEIYVKPEQVLEANVSLQSITVPSGTIEVNMTPGGGVVCLDGMQCDANVGLQNEFGITRFVDVSADTQHTITINMTDYQPYITQVFVNEGQTSEVYAPLHPVPIPTKAKLNEFIALTAMVICGVILSKKNKT